MPRQLATRNGNVKTKVAHQKSRNGCINCKRRKVKCDEIGPTCGNCIRFRLPCSYSLAQLISHPESPSPSLENCSTSDGVHCSNSTRRGRGRPRKNWTDILSKSAKVLEDDSVSPTSTAHAATSCSNIAPCFLNVADVELVLHFISSIATSLADSDDEDNRIVHFWAHNLPRIGLSHHFVLHLAYALAAYHLAYLQDGENERQRYISLATQHSSLGLAEMTKVLPHLDDSNCGALLVSAILVCYCTFAAGPTSPHDLLVCHVHDEKPVRWLPLVHGVRLIQTTVDPATLYSGLLTPLGPCGKPSPPSHPTCAREGFPRIDWEEPMHQLARYMASHDDIDVKVYQSCFDNLTSIYEATYGKKDESYNTEHESQFVFGWLYRLEDAFVARLQRREPLALIILAYYSLLFRTMKKCWFMDGWTDHILSRIRDLLEEEYVVWLQWPMEQARVE